MAISHIQRERNRSLELARMHVMEIKQFLSDRRVLLPVAVLALLVVSSALMLCFANYVPSQPRWGLVLGRRPNVAAAEGPPPTSSPPASAKEEDELGRVLEAADLGSKTVILTTLNAAWAAPGSVLDLFFEGFSVGNGTAELLQHVVIFATDGVAYERCTAAARTHCFRVDVPGGVDFSGEQIFNTADYVDMMWRRLDLLRVILEKGYSFVFTDTDILWLRNPLPHLYADGDLQISCDKFFGNPTGMENSPSNGFIYVKSSARTVVFYKYWCSLRAVFAGRNEQDVFAQIMRDECLLRRIGLKIMFLDTKYFSGLCETGRDMNTISTMHVNCRIGQKSKENELRAMLGAWKKYISEKTQQ